MRRQTAIGWLHHDVTHRGITAWLLSAAILLFYIVLYFGHRLGQGQWSATESGIFYILFAGIVGVGGYMLWSDSQEAETVRKAQMTKTAIGLVATLLLATFVYFTPALMKMLGETGLAQSLSQLEWGATGNAIFQAIYGVILAFGMASMFAHRKEKGQPLKVLGLLAILLTSTLVVLFLSTYLILAMPGKSPPSTSLFYGVGTGLKLLLWFLVGFGGMLLVSLGGVTVMVKKKEHAENPHRFIGMVMLLSFFFTLVAAVHAMPTLMGALHAKQDPFRQLALSMGLDSKWVFYGLLYTVCITSGGSYMIWKYWHNKYQVIRTTVVMFVQATIAFSIPWILKLFQRPDYYFSYIWPLKVDYFYPSTIAYQIKSGLPVPFIVYSFVAGLFLAPLAGIVFGKRWYCSWVCGCGGLANTFGEPWRHLSNKSSKAWLFEKFSINAILVITILMTIITALAWYSGNKPLGQIAMETRGLYGLGVSAVLSGVVGVGLYPLGGTRVWCRFACPMAALLGLLQKLGRFRIRVKRDMCISCGLCSKYCEMGIDVRNYAQSNQNFTRASCVGCGLCSEVCPRGVLRLENVPRKTRKAEDLGGRLNQS